MVFMTSSLCHAQDDGYFGDWQSKEIDGISFEYEFGHDNKMRIKGLNNKETFILKCVYSTVRLSENEYLLNYQVTSVIKNDKKLNSLESFNPIYGYGVIKIENGKMIIKTRGSHTPNKSIRPKMDGAGPPLVLTRIASPTPPDNGGNTKIK